MNHEEEINLDELIASLEAEAREEFSEKAVQEEEEEEKPRPREAVRKKSTPKAGPGSSIKRQMRRRRIGLTVLLLAVLVLLAAAAGSLLYIKRGESFSYLPRPYDVIAEFDSTADAKENLRADTFAKKLCVVGKDTPYEGISIPQGEKGLLLNLAEQETIFSQNAFGKSYPASITKLVTAIMALEYGNLNETVTITQEDVDLEEFSQVCGFMPGDKLSLDQLLHCLLVYSGNDAAMAIAEHIGGTIDHFVDMMNDYAASVGCTGTHFVNPHGLQDENHYSTPYDIYLILKEAVKFPEFAEISQLPSYTVEYYRADGTFVKTLLDATDRYLTGEAALPKNVVILGGKTGFTNEAGNCLALMSQNAYGQPFVSIVMGAPEKDDLYAEMNELLQVIND